jgi:hypothetical protein
MKNLLTLGAASFVILLLGCDHPSGISRDGPAEDKAGVTNKQATVDTGTVDKLATARCNRELTCKNIGGGMKWASSDVCMNDFRGSIANELNSYTCPGGFDGSGVEHCMAALQNEECSHPLDTLQRLEKCRTEALCAKKP